MDTFAETIPTEGDKVFPVEETDADAADSSTETSDTDDTQSDEGDNAQSEEETDGGKEENFAKHPRWKEREQDWKQRFNEQEERHAEELAKIREMIESRDTKTASSEAPSWWGGDEASWEQFQEWNRQHVVETAKAQAIQELTQKTDAEQKAIDEATRYFEDQYNEIVAETGERVDKNKLLKVTLDNELVDTNGRWNYKAAHKLMKAGVDNKKDEVLAEKKKIAGATTSEKKAETKPKDYATSEDFSVNRPW